MFAYFDIGGTKTRVAVSADGTSFGDPLKFDTPADFDVGIESIAAAIRSLAQDTPIKAAGGGIAGPLDRPRTMLVNSPNLPGWVGRSVTDELGERLGCPVYLENDSAIVALGEAHHGAGKGDPIMAYLTVSTGIGGSRIVDGYIDRNVFGFEPGHQILDVDKTMFPSLATDEAEGFLSGTAVANRFHRKAYEVTDPAVWEELAKMLAYLLNNTIVHWSPHSVVLGGSMIVGNPAIPVDRVEHHLGEILTIFPEQPRIKRATLADLGGLYGAMVYVSQQRTNAHNTQ
jgi:predicted NBD/HSP70 family sugar kinase